MNARAIVCTALAATLGFGSAAQARDANHDGHQGGNRHAQAQAQRHGGNDRVQQAHQGRQNYQRQYPQQQYSQQRQYPQRQYTQRQYAQRQYAQPQYRAYGNYAPQYRSYSYAPQYAGYSHAPRYWTGGYAPSYYRAQRYWVNDWRGRGYAPPPYGYQWVETDTGDVLLIALATGLIASAILAQ